jgi:rSAM/selenodomain-associated transferase 1
MDMNRVRADPLAIAVLARAPVPGAAKTRLIPRLGPEGAAALHARLVRHSLQTACAARLGPVTLWCAPNVSHPFFAACAAEFDVVLRPQPDGDLGARMHAAFVAHGPALLIGTDCPVITPNMLRACAAALTDHDAVFLPAEDGGYGLVGLKRPEPSLFDDMDWGTDTVMDETRRRLAALSLTWAEPATIWDVDRPGDLDRLAASGLLPDQSATSA